MRVQSSLALLASLTSTIAYADANHVNDSANHIFNAIHSSMRQWGSSLYHNGMSFFLASVPAGTLLYHGSHAPDPVTGTEWLAFEPEHALLFARMPIPPMGSHPPRRGRYGGQRPLSVGAEDEDRPQLEGWLHTYAATRDLRLLYVDGMSAGKTTNGTLDSQSWIIFNDTITGNQVQDERKRASEFCRMAREVWDDRLDGLLRMEAGFEIILCSFGRDLQILRADQVKPNKKFLHNPSGPGTGRGNGTLHGLIPDTGPWFRAITARYHGIGGNRVAVDYDHFVTAYTYGLELFGGESKKYRPRLKHLDSSQLEPIRRDLNTLIMTHDTTECSFNWQVVADMVVERYAHALKYLASGDLSTTEQMHETIQRLLDPFFSYPDRNTTVEAERCANQFIPFAAPTQGTAARAVRFISQRICWELLETAEETDYDTIMAKIQNLVEYLSWTTWKECRGCKDNEICVIPIWPIGIEEDYDHPQCRDEKKPEVEGTKYWG